MRNTALSVMALVLAVLSVMTAASPALAMVGVLPTVVDAATSLERKAQLDSNIRTTLKDARYVLLDLKGCDPTDAKCIPNAIALQKEEIDEVAQVSLRRKGPNTSEMTLKLWARDGTEIVTWTEDIRDEEALDATTALLKRAFDPKDYGGTLVVKGASRDREILVDGLTIERDANGVGRAKLRKGKHVVEVLTKDAPPAKYDVDIDYDKTAELMVSGAARPTAPRSDIPFYVASTVAGLGVGTLVGFAIAFPLANYNVEEWGRRARGRTFPSNDDDPLCREQQNCVEGNKQNGWLVGYGPQDGNNVGQGARFMMVALSRDNELKWETSRQVFIGMGIAGALTAVTGGLAAWMLWPAAEEAPPPEGETGPTVGGLLPTSALSTSALSTSALSTSALSTSAPSTSAR